MAMAISTFMLLATAPKSALAANPTPNPTYCDAPIALGYGCGDESITGHNWFNLYFDTAADCQEEWLSYDCSENSDDESTSDTTFIWSDYDSGGDGNCGCTGLTAYDSSCTDTFDDKVFMYEYCAPSPTSIPTSSVPTTLPSPLPTALPSNLEPFFAGNEPFLELSWTFLWRQSEDFVPEVPVPEVNRVLVDFQSRSYSLFWR